ncbi:MAG TPA: hypothetical protein EYO59_13050 [Chromatiaceae bacterium]|nr:hypothetical protein [Chromatiaceae bacterium]
MLLVFILCLRLAFQFLSWSFSPSRNPYLFKGLFNALSDGPRTFSSNPNIAGSIPILRSTNQDQGVEFTWSTWIHIKSLDYRKNKPKHIFHKGSPLLSSSGNQSQSPGLWIHPYDNTLIVKVDVHDQPTSEIEIPSIPLNKWINVMIRTQGKILDVFINGAIAQRQKLPNSVKQNYGDTYILEDGGFDGEISNLTYFSHALNVSEILDIVNSGPNLARLGDAGAASYPPYLSLRWYFRQ